MKNIINNYRRLVANFFKCILLLCCAINYPVFAGPAPTPQPQCTICTLNDTINNNQNSLVTFLSSFFVTGFQPQDKPSISLGFDAFDHYSTISNIDIITTDRQLENYISSISSNLVSYYLAGIDTKANEMSYLNSIAAEDTSGTTPTITSYTNVLNPTQAGTATAIMNMDTLLGPLQYTSDQQLNAQNVLRYLENLSPVPDIIRISNTFTIPYPDPNIKGSSTTPIDLTISPTDPSKTLSKSETQKLITSLQNTLETDPTYAPSYIQYKTSYRSAVLARTMLMNNLLRLYQVRIPPTDSTKQSIAATDYKSATWRLSKPTSPKQKSYMNDIKQASPATISRESLLLLAEIHYDLYKIQQQNEQLVALQSLNNLQLNQINSMASSGATKQIAKDIFCWYDQQKNGGTNKNSDCVQAQAQGTPSTPTTSNLPNTNIPTSATPSS